MKIRLHGTRDECREAAERIRQAFNVVAASDPYPDRPPSQLYRVYLEVRLP